MNIHGAPPERLNSQIVFAFLYIKEHDVIISNNDKKIHLCKLKFEIKNGQAFAWPKKIKLVLGTILGEAITAVHGPIAAGLEGNLGGAAATIADHFIHLAFATVATVLTTGSAARGAAAGLVLEALFGIESLFGSSEGEFLAAFTASERLVLIH